MRSCASSGLGIALLSALALLQALPEAVAQQVGPTLAQPPREQSSPAISDAKSATEALAEVYERTKSAKTADEFGEIIEVCERALALQPTERIRKYAEELAAWGYNRRGEVYADQAAQLFTQGSQREANELDALALDDFQAAVSHDPAKWKALHNRGVSLALHGKLEEALADFDRVIELKPDYANAHFNRGEIRSTQRDFATALEDYSRALEHKADDVGALVGRGTAHLRMKKLAEAQADFDQALVLSPQCAPAACGKAEVAMAYGQWNEAGAEFRQAIKLDSHLGRAYRGVAWLLATCPSEQFRNAELAVQSAQRAVEIDDNDWANLDALAAAQASAGNYDEAVAKQRQAIRLAPEDVAPYLHARLSLYQNKRPFRQSEQTVQPTAAAATR